MLPFDDPDHATFEPLLLLHVCLLPPQAQLAQFYIGNIEPISASRRHHLGHAKMAESPLPPR